MADETTAAATQADDAAQSQADNTTTESTATNSQAEQEVETISLDEAKKLRSEAAQLRKRTKDAEAKLKEMQDAQLSDTEKLQQAKDKAEGEAADLRTKYQQALLKSAVMEAASDAKVGAKNPARLLRLVDVGALTFGDDGSVSGLDAQFKSLKAEFPELFVQPGGQADGGAGTRTATSEDMNTAIRRAAGRT